MMVSNMRLSDLKGGNFKKLLFYLSTTVVSNVYISGCILARVIIFRYSCRELAAQQDCSLELFFWLRGGGGEGVERVYPRPTRFFSFLKKLREKVVQMCMILYWKCAKFNSAHFGVFKIFFRPRVWALEYF